MRLIERYLFRQLMGPTLAATAALTAVAVLSQALSSIGVLVNDRQSALVFAKLILLAMPQLIVLILPVAILVAGFVGMNRLHTENEIVVCFAGGLNRWRVLSPGLRLASLLALASLVLTLWVQPLCYRQMRDILTSIRSDLLATMIKPGQFTHPAQGLTVYARNVAEDGEIHDLFLDRLTPLGHETTITARYGRLQAGAGEGALLLRQGSSQELSPSGALNYLSFDEYGLDLRSLMGQSRTVRYKLSDRYLHELFFPDTSQPWEAANVEALAAEGHARLAAPIYDIAFMILAVAAVIGGPFTRSGYAMRMAAASGVALFARTAGFAVEGLARHAPAANLLQYLVPLAVCAAASWALFGPPRRARRAVAPRLSPA
ncbi:MAG TPA: LPS export ABC transporter permease LptF [Caulobacteraceae bacterium]|jgi:lipopolysaccharide export system permease protein|nr:LPS export ABC transporter permease LptF [Caulobacteraceae bacterium]